MEKNKTSLIEKLPDMALKPRFIELTFEQMMKFSAIVSLAGTKGLSKEESMTVMMRGQELGVSPIASHEVISLIKSKKGSNFAYHYSLYLALIRKNLPEAEIKFIRRDHEGCVIKARRSKSEDFMEFSFLKADAQRANLLGKDNWRHYPTDLYCSKAVLRMGRILFGDVLLGLKDTPETILDWNTPLVDKISKSKKGKKKDAIDITPEKTDEYDWGEMDKAKKTKEDADKKTATEAFLKATEKSSKKGGLKLALTPKKPKEKTQDKTLKETLDEDQELQDNLDAIADVIDEVNQKAFAKKDKKEPKTIVKPFNPKKKLGLKKVKKDVFPGGVNLKKITEKIVTKQLSTEPAPKKLKKEMVIRDADWEEIPIIELLSYKYVDKFDLCHSKSKNKVKYDIISKGFIELIEAYFIMYDIDEGVPFEVKFKEIIQTKKKVQPVFAIYQKAFKETFPDAHYHDLMKGFYDLTAIKIKELIITGEANVGKPPHEFWGGYDALGYRPDHNVWIHEFLKKNNLFTVDEEIVRRISA